MLCILNMKDLLVIHFQFILLMLDTWIYVWWYKKCFQASVPIFVRECVYITLILVNDVKVFCFDAKSFFWSLVCLAMIEIFQALKSQQVNCGIWVHTAWFCSSIVSWKALLHKDTKFLMANRIPLKFSFCKN